MTAELVRGQNHLLSQTRVEVRITAGVSVIAGATLADERGVLCDPAWIAHPGSPRLPGVRVSQQAAAQHRLAVDLEALPDGAEYLRVLLALPEYQGAAPTFGSIAAPVAAVTTPEGVELARYTLLALGMETAVVALELYRRNDVWKVRAFGQGYAGGLAAMLRDQGLPAAAQLATVIQAAVVQGQRHPVAVPPVPPAPATADQTGATTTSPDSAAAHRSSGDAADERIDYRHPRRRSTVASPSASPTAAARVDSAASVGAPSSPFPQPVAGDAAGRTAEERLYNQVWGMFEDMARTVAAYRGAVGFAESRRERELDCLLSDVRARSGPGAASARDAALAKAARLIDQAQAALDRDLAQLLAEASVVEPAMPPAFARWDSPVWQGYQVPTDVPMAVRIGDLSLPECADLRIPLLVRLPLERGLWIDSGRGDEGDASAVAVDSGELRHRAAEMAVAIAVRLLASHPVDAFAIQVIDPAGAASGSLAPLRETGALSEPPVVDAAGVASLLTSLTQRVDLLRMANSAGAADALPPELDTGERLLLVHDFPHGFDDRALTQLRYLVDEGPAAGVHLLMVADRADAQIYGPLLDPLWRALLRVTPVRDDHLADPWVGHAWTYEPPLVPVGSQVLHQVLCQVRQARQRSAGTPGG